MRNAYLSTVGNIPRITADDALSEKEYEELLKGVEKLGQPKRLEARFIILVAGRLGLRAGEISHMKKQWIDFERELIKIPYYEPCDCGYCIQQAKQEVKYNDGLTLEEAMENRWHAKTEESARAVPFGFKEEVSEMVSKFFEKYDKYPHSRISINRRVNKVAEKSDFDIDIYPHALRGTAATRHAYNGLPAIALQNLMGWSKIETAQKYLRKSAGATNKALNEIYSKVRDGNENG